MPSRKFSDEIYEFFLAEIKCPCNVRELQTFLNRLFLQYLFKGGEVSYNVLNVLNQKLKTQLGVRNRIFFQFFSKTTFTCLWLFLMISSVDYLRILILLVAFRPIVNNSPDLLAPWINLKLYVCKWQPCERYRSGWKSSTS